MTDTESPTASPRHAPSHFSGVLSAALVVVVTLLVYGPVVGHEFLDWDDWTTIQQNPRLNPPTLAALKYYWTRFNPHEEFYVPVNYTVWWLVAQVAGVRDAAGNVTLSAAPFHAINLFSHTFNALLVLLILRRLAPWWPAAVIGALLFSLHPVQVEPVAWASSMYSALSGTFALLAVLEFMKFSDLRHAAGLGPAAPEGTARRRGAWVHYALATVSFAAAMMTKPNVVTLPLIVAAIEAGLRGRRLRGLVLPLGFWLVLAAPAVLLARASQADAPVFPVAAHLRPLVALDALAFYLGKLVAPIGLCPDYGRSPHWLFSGLRAQLAVTWVVPVVLLVACAAVWRRARWPLVCAAVIVAALLPSLGLVPFDYQRFSTVADRYLYLAMLGAAIAAALVLSRRPRQGTVALGAAVVVVLGVLSFRQTRHWRNTSTLFAQALSVNPRSLAAHSVFGYHYARRGHDDRAVAEYRLALEANPGDPRVLYLLGNVLLRHGQDREAEQAYREAMVRAPRDVNVRVNLGAALAKQGRGREARAALEEALVIHPANGEAHASLGMVLLGLQDAAGAREHFEEAMRLSPDSAVARRGLARLAAEGQ